jgi:hypothetical protein
VRARLYARARRLSPGPRAAPRAGPVAPGRTTQVQKRGRCSAHRHDPLETQWRTLGSKLRGHFGYYGIVGNFRAIARFREVPVHSTLSHGSSSCCWLTLAAHVNRNHAVVSFASAMRSASFASGSASILLCNG